MKKTNITNLWYTNNCFYCKKIFLNYNHCFRCDWRPAVQTILSPSTQCLNSAGDDPSIDLSVSRSPVRRSRIAPEIGYADSPGKGGVAGRSVSGGSL